MLAVIAVQAALPLSMPVPQRDRAGRSGALLLVAGGPLVSLRLLVFGGAAVLLHAVSAGLVPVRRSWTPRP